MTLVKQHFFRFIELTHWICDLWTKKLSTASLLFQQGRFLTLREREIVCVCVCMRVSIEVTFFAQKPWFQFHSNCFVTRIHTVVTHSENCILKCVWNLPTAHTNRSYRSARFSHSIESINSFKRVLRRAISMKGFLAVALYIPFWNAI